MNAAVVALILVVSAQLAERTIFTSVHPGEMMAGGAIAGLSIAILLIWNINSTWLILGSILVGYFLELGLHIRV